MNLYKIFITCSFLISSIAFGMKHQQLPQEDTELSSHLQDPPSYDQACQATSNLLTTQHSDEPPTYSASPNQNLARVQTPPIAPEQHAQALQDAWAYNQPQASNNNAQAGAAREAEFRRIAHSAAELSQLMQELNDLVIDGGQVLDRIDYHIPPPPMPRIVPIPRPQTWRNKLSKLCCFWCKRSNR